MYYNFRWEIISNENAIIAIPFFIINHFTNDQNQWKKSTNQNVVLNVINWTFFDTLFMVNQFYFKVLLICVFNYYKKVAQLGIGTIIVKIQEKK